MKSKSTIFLLWLCGGLWGLHRFYVGNTGSGCLYAMTCGFFFIGWATDFFKLNSMVDEYNQRFIAQNAPAKNENNNNNNENKNENTNNIVVNLTAPAPYPQYPQYPQQPNQPQQPQQPQQ